MEHHRTAAIGIQYTTKKKTSIHSSEVEEPWTKSIHGETSPIGRPNPKISHHIQPIIVVSPTRSLPTSTFQPKSKKGKSTTLKSPMDKESTTLKPPREIGKFKRPEATSPDAKANSMKPNPKAKDPTANQNKKFGVSTSPSSKAQ